MKQNYVYLCDIKYEGKGKAKGNIFIRPPAGIQYNCFSCKKIMFTEISGSYKYCLRCYNNYEKAKKNDEFID